MIVKFAIVLLSTLARCAVLVESSSTRLGRAAQDIKAGGDGERQTNHLRKMKTVQGGESIAHHDGETINEADSSSFIPGLRALRGEDDSKNWNHGSYAVASKRSGNIKLNVPQDTQVGDTLFLFLSRTDGILPIRLDRWTRGAECFKSDNDQDHCLRASDCIQDDGPYCLRFRDGRMAGNGRDLGTVMFYRKVTGDDPGYWNIDLPGGTTTWAIITAITNVNEQRPIVSATGASCDRASDSVFSSVYGKKNDVLLLSQSFDDTASASDFKPPAGTSLFGWTRSDDEAGFLFGERLDHTGQTGKLITGGPGGSMCKDALLSVVVNRN
ncbi:hypothetical protein ACHAW5_009644 [Stephanodiscus triporus]|uniref:Uncharacterized protein n=1 Tax=Stephanodiscus triporus TaxID=2934178 RepID=A0ABD3Q9S9_9STRA